MDHLLLALGRPPSFWQRFGLVGLCLTALVGWLVAGQIALLLLPRHPVLTQAVAWCGWFVWQGWRFARRRERYLQAAPDRAYVLAFTHDILPGAGTALWLVLVNVAAMPVYGFLEDRRLVRVFGQSYAEYRAKVGGFVPRHRR